MMDDLPFDPPQVIAQYNRATLAESPERYGEHLCETARATFLEVGEMPLITLLYGQAAPPWLVPGAEKLFDVSCAVWALPLREANETTKTLFGRLLPAIVRSVRGVAVGIAYEGWAYRSDSEEESARQAQYKREHGGSIEGYPGVTEALFVSFETQAAVHMWTAPIIRPPGSDAQVGHFEPAPRFAIHEGRFAGILARVSVGEPQQTEA